jgi:lipocalin
MEPRIRSTRDCCATWTPGFGTRSLVGTPDRRYLWMLSRTPRLDEPTYQHLVAKAQRLGFPVSDLIKTKRLPAS